MLEASLDSIERLRSNPAAQQDPRIELIAAASAEQMGRHEAAAKAARKATSLASALGATHLAARAHQAEAYSLLSAARLPEALVAAENARQLFAESGDLVSTGRVLARFAVKLVERREVDLAQGLLDETRSIVRDHPDPAFEADIAMARGLLARASGDRAEFARYLEQARQTFSRLGDVAGNARVDTCLGVRAATSGEGALATRLWADAAAGFREVGDGLSASMVEENLAWLALNLGHVTEAQTRFQTLAAQAQAIGRYAQAVRVLV
ncbi:MAG: hypothetical protein AAF604_01985, partial [Acidobacteriota bacterium]